MAMPMKLKNKKAFTLIELLVVIVVIALLMAIIVPALAKARQQSKALICLNNLKQMALAAAIHTNSNNGHYPSAYYNPVITSSGTVSASWDFTVIDNAGDITIEPGILWQGDMIKKIQQCPSFKGDSNNPHDPYTGYNYNVSYIGHGQSENIPTPARATQVARPGECALFGDGEFTGGANKYMRSPLRAPGDRTFSARYSGTQGYRHNGKTNVAWCDGHASSQRQLYTETKPTRHKNMIEDYNETADVKVGFLSPDNSAYDLQ